MPGRPDRQARQKSWLRGRRAEWLAVQYLRLKGYRLLDRNVDTPYGEVDLVLHRDKTVIITEVKMRSAAVPAGGAVTVAQQQRISRAARHLAGLRLYGGPDDGLRIDLVVLRPGRWPEHMPDAWRP